jgi:hypothetical protein
MWVRTFYSRNVNLSKSHSLLFYFSSRLLFSHRIPSASSSFGSSKSKLDVFITLSFWIFRFFFPSNKASLFFPAAVAAAASFASSWAAVARLASTRPT